ncbi:MAG: glycosyltransferase [Chloroflexi bacterium]|nr:glycosyltransferase [Chloroflexota bacterium]
MRFHLFGLATVPTRQENTYSPFTPLTWRMAAMLKRDGHEVVFYGAHGSDAPCDEFVELVSANTLAPVLRQSGQGVPNSIAWNNALTGPQWSEFIARGKIELRKRYRTGDISLISFGFYQRFVEELSELSCEFIAGYSGIFARHKVFPSYAWRNYLYGELKMETKPEWSDAVIPHSLRAAEFPFRDKKDEYLLFCGRLCPEKGPDIAIDIANRTGRRIVVAGVDQNTHGIPEWLRRLPGKVEFAGFVGPERRAELMAGAAALVHPCRYIEPFGLVLIEAMACGTPVIASDFGAIPEIVQEGVTGFRCRDMDDFCRAVNHATDIRPQACRERVEREYSEEAIYPQYRRYFDRLLRLLDAGWYETCGTWRGDALVTRLRPMLTARTLAGAEIGVDRGSLCAYLLRELPGVTLHLVDTWTAPPVESSYARSGDTCAQRSQDRRNGDYARAIEVTAFAADRRRIHRCDSVAAANVIPDNSLDFVFIDGDHSHEGVSRDLRAWYPKVRPGGFISGHDWRHPAFPQWGVELAVKEFAQRLCLPVECDAGYTWFMVKPLAGKSESANVAATKEFA